MVALICPVSMYEMGLFIVWILSGFVSWYGITKEG